MSSLRDRRRFLQTLGALAGTAAAAPVLAGDSPFSLAAPSLSGQLRVGIALPEFGAEERRAQAWLAGLKLGLGQAAAIEIEAAGALAMQVCQASERLLQRGVQVVVGAIAPIRARDVGRSLQRSNAVFLNAEPGAHILRANDGHAKVFHHTLHAWQASYATGRWAAGAAGRRAAIVASFRESGYDTLAAFRLGFAAAGGEVVSQEISGIPGRERSAEECLQSVQCQAPDFVYAAGTAVAGAVGAPLSSSAQGRADQHFADCYAQFSGRAADAFALLGFEAGSLLQAAAQQALAQGLSLARSLASAGFQGPRGLVRMNPATRSTTAESFVDAAGARLPHLQTFDEQMVLADPSWRQAVSGWVVPYAA